MTFKERGQFIKELIENVQHDIFSKLEDMPDDWTGIELRQYIADKFQDSVFKNTLDRKRKKKYKNDVIINNL